MVQMYIVIIQLSCLKLSCMLIFSRVATKSVSAYNMMYVVRAAGRQVVNFFVSTQYLKNEMSDLNETWYTYA
jgi:hypothetical protein